MAAESPKLSSTEYADTGQQEISRVVLQQGHGYHLALPGHYFIVWSQSMVIVA
jgi:hypothetical protein